MVTFSNCLSYYLWFVTIFTVVKLQILPRDRRLCTYIFQKNEKNVMNQNSYPLFFKGQRPISGQRNPGNLQVDGNSTQKVHRAANLLVVLARFW